MISTTLASWCSSRTRSGGGPSASAGGPSPPPPCIYLCGRKYLSALLERSYRTTGRAAGTTLPPARAACLFHGSSGQVSVLTSTVAGGAVVWKPSARSHTQIRPLSTSDLVDLAGVCCLRGCPGAYPSATAHPARARRTAILSGAGPLGATGAAGLECGLDDGHMWLCARYIGTTPPIGHNTGTGSSSARTPIRPPTLDQLDPWRAAAMAMARPRRLDLDH